MRDNYARSFEAILTKYGEAMRGIGELELELLSLMQKLAAQPTE